MNLSATKIFTKLLFLLIFSAYVFASDATNPPPCTEEVLSFTPPTLSLTADPAEPSVALGEVVTFTATMKETPGSVTYKCKGNETLKLTYKVTKWTASGPLGYSDSGDGGSADVTCDDPGTYNVSWTFEAYYYDPKTGSQVYLKEIKVNSRTTAYEVRSLTVSGAKRIGTTNVYVAGSASSGDVVITATLNPSGTQKIQWTGGNAGSGELERKVSLSTPASTDVTATLGSSSKMVTINVIKVNKIQVKIGTPSADWKDFDNPQKILLGRRAYVKATEVLPSGITVPSNFIQWSGTYGFTGTGVEPSGFTYSGAAATTDSDTKDVKTNCGPDQPGKMLVCQYVIGIHSNTAPTSSLTSGHAWISVTTFTSSGGHTTITYGLWPDDHPLIIQDGLANGPGSDVRVNREPAIGLYNRYYLLTPSQNDARVTYVATSNAWGYFFTCANWASAAYSASTGESVSASDYVLFGTPRAIAGSIKSLEDANPTQLLQPEGGGDRASSTSAGSSGGGSSFP